MKRYLQVQMFVVNEESGHTMDDPMIVQSFAVDLMDGDDLGLRLNSMAQQLCERLQKSGWGDDAVERVIVGPPPLRLVK